MESILCERSHSRYATVAALLGAQPAEDTSLAVLEHALHVPARPLAQPGPRLPGAYALVYRGDHPLYRPLAETGWPIYVGSTPRLIERLARHRTSISQLSDVAVEDFDVVAVSTPGTGEGRLVEVCLQQMIEPVWNRVITGLGTRTPGAGRPGVRGRATALDVVHGSRAWADGGVDEVRQHRLMQQAREHLAGSGRPCGQWPRWPAQPS